MRLKGMLVFKKRSRFVFFTFLCAEFLGDSTLEIEFLIKTFCLSEEANSFHEVLLSIEKITSLSNKKIIFHFKKNEEVLKQNQFPIRKIFILFHEIEQYLFQRIKWMGVAFFKGPK